MTQELEKQAPGQEIEMPPLPEEPAEQEETPTETPSEEPAQAHAQSNEDEKERNYRELRRSKEAAEKERDEMKRMLEEMKKTEQNKQKEEEDPHLNPDDIPEWRHVEKYIKKLESRISNYEQQTQLQSTEARLKQQYPDFDQVVSAENIEALKQKYPELASNLASNSDMYSKAVSAYTMIKRLGIVPDNSYDGDKERAQKNAAKPRPLASVSPQQGDSPLSRANAFAEGLTDELREQLRKEMQEAIKYR